MLSFLLGSRNDRWLARARRQVSVIERLEPDFQAMSPEQLQQITPRLRSRLALGTPLDELLPEMFAAVREAAHRTLGLRAYPVQLLGAIALHQGCVAQMQTGEGKTLVAIMAACLRALEGCGVHVVTVNEYLARRDAQGAAKVASALGLTVGLVEKEQEREAKRSAYAADITYGTNNEIGFDYLRDHLVMDPKLLCLRPLHAAIVDEVDNILIDEARTPLVISGPDQAAADLYPRVDAIARELSPQENEASPGDFYLDPKTRRTTLSEYGQERADALFEAAGLLEGEARYDHRHLLLLHHLHAALRAHHAYRVGQDYVIEDGKVVVVDEFTGRTVAGRRWGEGLHQAVEAAEGVSVQPEDRVLASITLQNFFRSYPHLSGMTGTAATEQEEFEQIYGLPVIQVPTHKPMIRVDHDDHVFLSRAAADRAMIEDLCRAHQAGRPVLVGTASIVDSEQLSSRLSELGLPHQVLNATLHAQEASIIAQAGQPGRITLATNMAGRGTDIVLGGGLEEELSGPELQASNEARAQAHQRWQERHDQVVAAGGLHVIGTQRHESRRIDHQLRGRAGRQGDPGSSRFFLSLEDRLLKAFMPEWSRKALERAGAREDTPVASSLVSRQVQAAQTKIEGMHSDRRRAVLDYDNIVSSQRQALYRHRQQLLHAPLVQLQQETQNALDALASPLSLSTFLAGLPEEERLTRLRAALLSALDEGWQDLLQALDLLRAGIHLRALAQKKPLEEYRREAFALFEQMTASLPERTARFLQEGSP